MEDIPVKPVPSTKYISRVEIYCHDFQLKNKCGWFQVNQFNEEGGLVEVSRVFMPEEAYALWGTDDDYVVDFCLQHLGFEKQ
jgi:hypothetical protein